jgi:hypothetical protein
MSAVQTDGSIEALSISISIGLVLTMSTAHMRQVAPAEVLVDAANVIGSRPNGWWRNRAAAARALLDELEKAVTSGRFSQPLTVVLEGDACAAVPAGPASRVMVIHARGTGDETLLEIIAERSGRAVVLVTADRDLSKQAQALGARTVGPGWLLSRLGEGDAVNRTQ